jgi:prepilin-type N-terminal cleavage/methylation domain-containing protein
MRRLLRSVKRAAHALNTQGFSLLELSMVLLVSGVAMTFIVKSSGTTQGRKCFAATQGQLYIIKDAVEDFVRKNDRLPLPAARNIGSNSDQFGR